ncbi:macrolide 2'-phosphotransferase [Pseudarthrobacter sp. L19]|uniref:macrolide 2'-phosphotransferase n=1 Tax=Pseudarthrobacter sp. L19 TaxID=3423951 RepID=UPI003D7B6101
MRRNPIELAAVATAAVPGLTPTAVCSAPDDAADFDSALLLDSEGKRWRVRSPRHAEASARLETEFLVLRAFTPGIRAELPFLMPTVAGTVRQGELSTFVYAHLAGRTRTVEELGAGTPALAREVGAALAAIHDLPHSLVSNADLPTYTPNEFRQRRLNELDQAATTGKIPPLLLRRWEHALEDVTLWRFNPSVVHGDLHEDNIMVDGERVTAVTGWTDLRIGDPADDMAWLVASNDQDFVDSVLAAYSSARRDTPDAHLLRRAALSAEFALAQYLVRGLAAGDTAMVAEGESMLALLADDVAAHGGQPISVEPLPAPAPTQAPAVTVQPIEPGAETPGMAAPEAATGQPAPLAAAPAVHVTPIPDTPAADEESSDGVPSDAKGEDAGEDNAEDNADDTADDGAQADAAPSRPTTEDRSPADGSETDSDSPDVAGSPAPASSEDTSTTALTVVPLHRH